MQSPLAEAEIRRVYLDALDRAMRHAAAHVTRDEAREIAHHVACAVARRCTGGAADGRASSTVGPVAELDAFVHRSVLNRIRETWRSKRRRAAIEKSYEDERAAIAPAWSQPGSDLESRELHHVIQATIADLPEVRRQVFLLVRRDGLSYKAVAARLGIGVGTVHTHLSRANAALRGAVAEFRGDGDARRAPGRERTIGTGT